MEHCAALEETGQICTFMYTWLIIYILEDLREIYSEYKNHHHTGCLVLGLQAIPLTGYPSWHHLEARAVMCPNKK